MRPLQGIIHWTPPAKGVPLESKLLGYFPEWFLYETGLLGEAWGFPKLAPVPHTVEYTVEYTAQYTVQYTVQYTGQHRVLGPRWREIISN